MREPQVAAEQLKVAKVELLAPPKVLSDQMQPLPQLEPPGPVHKEMLRSKQQDVVTHLLTAKQKATIDLFTIELLIPELLIKLGVARPQAPFKEVQILKHAQQQDQVV